MIKTLSTYEIADELKNDEYGGWSHCGAMAMAEYLEEIEDEDSPMEFDRVAIRCDFTEYEDLQEWAKDYFTDWIKDLDIEPELEEDEIEEKIREYINDHGILIEFDGGIIVSSF